MHRKIIGIALSIGIAGAAILDNYFIFFKPKTTSTASQVSQTATSTTASKTKSSTYRDGTYTGQATQTQWGAVQVKITIKNGRITDLSVLKHPDTNGHSQSINQQVLPTYKKEALQQQSSKIQQVSGATETYKGFTGSLQNALNQAKG